MATPTGGETIGERLTRLRADLARVRVTIARAENNGTGWAMGGSQVTEIAYEQALKRELELRQDIALLEARLTGGSASTATRIQTRFD